jgi:hypothetical protein
MASSITTVSRFRRLSWHYNARRQLRNETPRHRS